MGQVDTTLMYMAGDNQYQDPGLEPERRDAACKAVRHAVNRDVFYLDEMLTYCEKRSWDPWYAAQAESVLEEMLSHGCR